MGSRSRHAVGFGDVRVRPRFGDLAEVFDDPPGVDVTRVQRRGTDSNHVRRAVDDASIAEHATDPPGPEVFHGDVTAASVGMRGVPTA